MNPELFKGLPEWVRISKTRASKIRHWTRDDSQKGDGYVLHLEHGTVAVPWQWLSAYSPHAGGYLVFEESAGVGFAPAAVFERLYERSQAPTPAPSAGPVKQAYPGGLCPDCALEIPNDAPDGYACTNCGHSCHASVAQDYPAPVYNGVRCMCVLTGCRAGPGCPHYNAHCKAHIAHTANVNAAKAPVPETNRFYEVVFDDCDGARATLHVFQDCSWILQPGGTRKSRKALRRLARLWHDPEAPRWARDAVARLAGPARHTGDTSLRPKSP